MIFVPIDHDVTGSETYDATAKTATFTPSKDLVADTTYTVTIKSGGKRHCREHAG
jgi:hypothetical protein